jgi:hypothetical protein
MVHRGPRKGKMNESTSQLIKYIFSLLGVSDFLALSRAYTAEDQRLFKSGTWDPGDSGLLTNQVKVLLEVLNPEELNEEDREWRQEILWFWYHHAVSYAIFKAKSRDQAKLYANRALVLQEGRNHPNQMTRLLWFLIHDRLTDARKWFARLPPNHDEHATGMHLIEEYVEGKFF